MTFLNLSLLFGLAAILIPILIHLLNRSKPKLIDWGAMQFLLASVTARSRRVKIEDGALLCLRCLTLTLLVLAMARPFLPRISAIPWVLVFPAILLAILATGMATLLRERKPWRRRLLVFAGLLVLTAVLSSLLERHIQAQRWMTSAKGGDTVILLDASLSMTLTRDGESTFSHALNEARTLINRARPGDAFAIILGGPVPQPLIKRPTADRQELLRVLGSPECRPTGGTMATLEALNLATALLAEGPNLSKSVVIFTDGQSQGWDPQAEARWRFLAEGFKTLPSPPRILCRRLPCPETFHNATLLSIQPSRLVVGTDRPVSFDVTVINSGKAPIRPSAIEWIVDGTSSDQTPILKDILPEASEVYHFSHRFTAPGYHAVQAKLVAPDDLPADNSMEQIIHVMDTLPVLLVEGTTSERIFFRKTASLIRMALTPREKTGETSNDADPATLVNPTLVDAGNLATLRDLSPYRVIILADVPRLPAPEAERLSAFVKAGGGLLITAGERVDPAFYNAWQTPSGEPLLPVPLEKRIDPADPLRLDLSSFAHPALHLVAQSEQSDARLGLISGYWQVKSRDPLSALRIGGKLESGDPWLLERQLGKGRLILIPMAFDRRDSNFSTLRSFVPLVHELVYYLTEPTLDNSHVQPGAEWSFSGPLPYKYNPPRGAETATLVTPEGEEKRLRIDEEYNRFVIRYADTHPSGIFRVHLPPALAPSTDTAGTNAAPDLLFSVNAQPGEGMLTMLSATDIAAIQSHILLFLPASLDEVLSSIAGQVPGQELWTILILCALLTLVAEALLTRWITLNRHLHQATPVELRSPAQSLQALKKRLSTLTEN